VFAAPANITLTASASDSGGSVAKVDFFEGPTLLGTATAAPYSVALANVTAGAHSYTAQATDNQGAVATSAAVNVTVDAAPAVSLSAPAANAVFTAPASIALSATATDTVGTVTKVDFYQGTTLIGTATAAPYNFTWTNVVQGSYSLTAVATNDAGQTATSAAVPITVNPGVAQVYYIEPDHLNTPRMIANSSGTAVWRWDQQEPFGSTPPNDNPSGAGAFEFPLRFPGQYFDRETNLNYNMARDYDPAIGGYKESDPIGLEGGLNTYAYVRANPLGFTDPEGLQAARIALAAALAAARLARDQIVKAYRYCSNIRCRIAVHDDHHYFGWPFNQKMCHVQLNCWVKGVSGSGFALRFPYSCDGGGAGGAGGAGSDDGGGDE
jgi:RHS repeat-associated protein